MRLHLQTSPNREIVPYAYQQKLVGALHKWLGPNMLHDELSLYSLSWLGPGKKKGHGLDFPEGTSFFISSPQEKELQQIIQGILASPEICYGMHVEEVRIQPTPRFSEQQRFFLQSPVLIKREIGSRETKFYFPQDPESDTYLTQTLAHKIEKVGRSAEAVKVYFDPNYRNPKTKLSTYRGIENKASFCPIIVEGKPEDVAFAWNVGVGNSTGIGFGALK